MPKRYIVGMALAVLVVAGLAVTLIGCGPVATDDEVQALVPSIMQQLPTEEGSILPLPERDLDGVSVYVDRTLSMQAFASDEREASYNRVFQVLDGVLASKTSFYGFGYAQNAGDQSVVRANPLELQEASAYSMVNNDYGELFSSFSSGNRENETHLVVSDGVQSDASEGSRFRGVVQSIGEWVEDGGVFVLYAYRSPYRGTYYHEVPEPGQVEYSCSDRPFYMFGFFPSVDAASELEEIFQDETLDPAYQIMIGEASATVSARSTTPSAERRSGPRILGNYNHHSPGVVRSVYSGRVNGEKPSIYFDINFDRTRQPWTALSEREMARVAETLEPSLEHWLLERADADSVSLPRLKEDAPIEYDPSVEIASQTDTVWQAHVKIPMSYDLKGPNNRLISLLTLRPSPTGANRLVPESLSTRRDDRPEACSQTLNLRRTLGAVLREHYVIGRSMLITKW